MTLYFICCRDAVGMISKWSSGNSSDSVLPLSLSLKKLTFHLYIFFLFKLVAPDLVVLVSDCIALPICLTIIWVICCVSNVWLLLRGCLVSQYNGSRNGILSSLLILATRLLIKECRMAFGRVLILLRNHIGDKIWESCTEFLSSDLMKQGDFILFYFVWFVPFKKEILKFKRPGSMKPPSHKHHLKQHGTQWDMNTIWISIFKYSFSDVLDVWEFLI